MPTLLIDHDKAHDVFGNIVQAYEALRGVYNTPEEIPALDNTLAGSIAELEQLISSAPTAGSRETGSIGRPAKSEEERRAQLAQLEAQIATTTDKATKLALGKSARRIRRSLSGTTSAK